MLTRRQVLAAAAVVAVAPLIGATRGLRPAIAGRKLIVPFTVRS